MNSHNIWKEKGFFYNNGNEEFYACRLQTRYSLGLQSRGTRMAHSSPLKIPASPSHQRSKIVVYTFSFNHIFGSTNFRVFTHLLLGNGQVWWWAPLVLVTGDSTGRNIQEIEAKFPLQNVHKIMEFHRLFLHPPRYLMILKYLTISHLDIWNHRCQATNLAGSSEQTTPVTVRHAGGSNVQCPKWDLYFNYDWCHRIALKRLLCLHGFCFTVTAYHAAARCPIDNYCLNGGNCAYYKSIGELVCR